MAGIIKSQAYCILEQDGRIMLTKDVDSNGYKLPGGAVEEDELIRDAAVREVKEEVGLDVNLIKLVTIQDYINPKPDHGHKIRFYFTAEVVGGVEHKREREVAEIKWVSKDELSQMTFEDFHIEKYYLAIQSYLRGKFVAVDIFADIG
jgi:8-oxo-dGTP diphosphatase